MHTTPNDGRDAESVSRSDAKPGPSQRRRWLKRLGIAAVVAVGLALAAGFMANWYAGAQRAALLERFDDLGIEATSVERDGGADLVGPAEVALSEASAIVRWSEAWLSDDLPAVGTRYVLEPRQALPGPMVSALRDLEADRLAVLAALRGAQGEAFERRALWVGRNFEGLMDRLGSVRAAARLLAVGLELAVLDGDADSIPETMAGLETLLRSLRGGLLVESLVEHSVRAIGPGAMEDALSRGVLPAATLRGVAERFDRWNGAVDVEAMLAGEMRSLRWTVERPGEVMAWTREVAAEKAEIAGDLAAASVGERWPARGMRWLFPEVSGWGLTWTTGDLVKGYARLVGALERDRLEALAVMEGAGERGVEGAAIVAPARTAVRVFDELAVGAAALRVEAWRLEYGDWPADLAAVHGGDTPTDWVGRLLVYRVEGGDAVVYAVGPNGVDDGARFAKADGDAVPASADDHARFWLYAAAERGALPAPGQGDETE